MSKSLYSPAIRQRGKASVLVMLSSEVKTEKYLAALGECFEYSEQHHDWASAAVGVAGGRGHIYRSMSTRQHCI